MPFSDIKKFIGAFLLFALLGSSGVVYFSTPLVSTPSLPPTATKPPVEKSVFVEGIPEPVVLSSSTDGLPPARPGNLTDNLIRGLVSKTFEKRGGVDLSSGDTSLLADEKDVNEIADYATDRISLEELRAIDKEEESLAQGIKIKENATQEDLAHYLEAVNDIFVKRLGNLNLESTLSLDASPQQKNAFQYVISATKHELGNLRVPSAARATHLAALKMLNNAHGALSVSLESVDPLKEYALAQLRLDHLGAAVDEYARENQKISPVLLSAIHKNNSASLFGVRVAHAQIPVTDGAAIAQRTMLTLQQKILAALRAVLKNVIIHNIIAQTINWINGNGKPQFITDWKSFAKETANVAVGTMLSYAVPKACQPFRAILQVALEPVRVKTYPVVCTLDRVLNDAKMLADFYNDFEKGGWVAYGTALRPSNNIWGSVMQFQINAGIEEEDAKKEQENKGLAGQGFKNQEQCKEKLNLEYNFCKARSEASGGKIPIAACEAYNTPDFIECTKKEATTPGTILGNSVNSALGANAHLVVNADDIYALTAAVANFAISKITKIASTKVGKELFNAGLGGLNLKENNTPPPNPNQGVCGAKTGAALETCLQENNFAGMCATLTGTEQQACVDTVCKGLTGADLARCSEVVKGTAASEKCGPGTAAERTCHCSGDPRDVGYDGFRDSDYQYGNVVANAQSAVRSAAETECGGGSNTQGLSCNNLDTVTDNATYLAKVVAAIAAQNGFSGHVVGEDEVGVKNGENRDEHYDIILGSGGVRTGGNIAVCKPADF